MPTSSDAALVLLTLRPVRAETATLSLDWEPITKARLVLSTDGIVLEAVQSDEDGFLAAPSVFSADHEVRLQIIENKGGKSSAFGL
jgi:hypothetical protein